MNSILYNPIGIIHSPHKTLSGMPIQPPAAKAFDGTVEIFPEYAEGLTDIEEFSRVMLIYHLHECCGFSIKPTPFLDTKSHGVFATRVPKRPNPIGFSVVKLCGRTKNILQISEVDVLDKTPVLDIKPYVPLFDAYPNECCGWFEGKLSDIEVARSDDRFV